MAARLRKTFHYPSSDDDSDASPSSPASVLDEQEQESLIASLAAQNAARNASFLRALSLLPPLAALPFLLGLFLATFSSSSPSSPSPYSSPAPQRSSGSTLSALLSLSSLAATAWLLRRQGATETGFAALDGAGRGRVVVRAPGGGGGGGGGLSAAAGSRSSWFGLSGLSGLRRGRLGRMMRGRGRGNAILGGGDQFDDMGRSPLERHLPLLNVGLAALALLTGVLEWARTRGGVGPVLLGMLPGMVYAVVVGAKVMMAGVDPERELSGLKYGYKGA